MGFFTLSRCLIVALLLSVVAGAGVQEARGQTGPHFPYSPVEKLFVTGKTDTLELPAAVGDGEFTYEITFGDLPAGLSFDVTTRHISGTPVTAKDRTRYTMTATGSDSTATYDFYIKVEINTVPDFSSATRIDYTFTPDSTPRSGLRLPQAEGGNGNLTYALIPTPALPLGLTYSSGRSGSSPSLVFYSPNPFDHFFPAVLEKTQYTLTATDEDGDQTSWPFHITVVDVEPFFDP
ncbi:MAG: putative Ig domain-containing protein, partial [Candidatus Dadabacteria bacterium]|nr:putative Ig domain-containing protein [Candidatus Dadabacteria bacterium]